MGLFDKIKDLFTDEEEVVEERELEVAENEEHKLPTIMRESLEKEEQTKQIIIPEKNIKETQTTSDRNLVDTNRSFKFPIDFEDKDFVDTKVYSSQNIMRKEQEKPKVTANTSSNIYNTKKTPKKEEPKFQASPIISPVYGVLNKNYSKEEVDVKKKSSYEIQRPSKKVDFETVRQKAFGTLSDEIQSNLLCESCELLKEAKENGRISDSTDLLADIREDNEIEDSNITLGDAEDNYYDFGVSYEPEIHIDKLENTTEIKIINTNDTTSEAEKIEVKEPVETTTLEEDILQESTLPSRSQKREEEQIEVNNDENISDDLFDLIDSMYEDKGEE